MAKQKGVIQVSGKIDNLSFYSQKYVEGGLVRKINEGMSERVKTAPEFENTRLVGREFGSAGSYAGAAIRLLTERWRYLLKPHPTATFTEFVTRLVQSDTENPIGQRVVHSGANEDSLLYQLSTFGKRWFDGNYADIRFDNARIEPGTVKIVYDVTFDQKASQVEWLRHYGAEGVEYRFYVCSIKDPVYLPSIEKYTEARTKSILTSNFYFASIDNDVHDTGEDEFSLADVYHGDTSLSFVLIIAKPYRTAGTSRVSLQHLCSYKCVPLPWPDTTSKM